MAHPNEEVVRAVYEAFLRGDLETAHQYADPDIVWHVPGRGPLSGDIRGVENVNEALSYVFGMVADGTIRLEVHDVLANDDHVVGLISEHAERDGKSFHDNFAQVSHVKDGKVTEIWNIYTDLYGRDEFWAGA